MADGETIVIRSRLRLTLTVTGLSDERSLAVGRRLKDVLELIDTGQHSAPAMAEGVGVAGPTASRDGDAFRERGCGRHAVRQNGGRRIRAVGFCGRSPDLSGSPHGRAGLST